MIEKLQSCPFCKGVKLLIEQEEGEANTHYVTCYGNPDKNRTCFAQGPFAHSEEEARAAWNRRATQQLEINQKQKEIITNFAKRLAHDENVSNRDIEISVNYLIRDLNKLSEEK